ncbi:MAG: hypothetical protein KDA88_05240 [Planctomycetaceae bacterium]|nr:hypothetical protein [Planctomycetaceae bacterium]MCB9949706.1 hypothetical protein [Planctomycetaceae bacterium]
MPLPRKILLAVLILALLVAALPLLTVTKKTGYFTLTIELDVTEDVDVASIRYLECWRERHLETLTQQGAASGFEEPQKIDATHHAVTMPSEAEQGAYGLIDKYMSPDYLLVCYRRLEATDDSYEFKTVRMPPGRGDRTLKLNMR